MIKPIYDHIPDELKQYSQWVNWRTVRRKDGSKPTKPPYQSDGKLAESNNPLTWSSFSVVKDAAPKFDGVGFVLTKDDPYIGIDFDRCRCPAFNLIDPAIEQYVRNLDSYTEVSPSGRGLRQILKGSLPVEGKKKGLIEAYQSGRYVTMTGNHLEGFPRTIENRQNELDEFYQAVFSEATKKDRAPKGEPLSATTRTEWQELLEKALQSKNGSEIRRLWEGDHSAYPSQSEGDLALCSYFAFWFDGDAKTVDEAFRKSGLYRHKWDQKHYGTGETYGQHTINQALKDNKIFYKEERIEEKNWGAPIPFDDYSLLPGFPAEMIPDVAGEMVRELADSCQVDMLAFPVYCC